MIGVFDSGLGGLSVLRALRAELPGQDFIYVADSGHAPYGERDAAHVQARARAVSAYLVGRGVQALVVACNTATAAAIHLLRAEHPQLPIVGVEPALKPAVALSPSGRIGVMATRGTLASDKFAALAQSLQGQAQFFLQRCDGLALAIERSAEGDAASAQALAEVSARHVQALDCAARGIDTVVLGCTHYPLIRDLLAKQLGAVQLVDTGQAVARQAARKLAELGGAASGEGSLAFFCTGTRHSLEHAARRWISPEAQVQALP